MDWNWMFASSLCSSCPNLNFSIYPFKVRGMRFTLNPKTRYFILISSYRPCHSNAAGKANLRIEELFCPCAVGFSYYAPYLSTALPFAILSYTLGPTPWSGPGLDLTPAWTSTSTTAAPTAPRWVFAKWIFRKYKSPFHTYYCWKGLCVKKISHTVDRWIVLRFIYFLVHRYCGSAKTGILNRGLLKSSSMLPPNV